MTSLSEEQIKKELKHQGFSNLDGSRTKCVTKNHPKTDLDQSELQKKVQKQGYSTLDGSVLSTTVRSSSVGSPAIERALACGNDASKLKLPSERQAAKDKYIQAAVLLSRIFQSGIVDQKSSQFITLHRRLEEYIANAERLALAMEKESTQQTKTASIVETLRHSLRSWSAKEGNQPGNIAPGVRAKLTLAVELDRQGQYRAALKEYKIGVSSLYDALQGIPPTDTIRHTHCQAILESYMKRAELLKTAIDGGTNGASDQNGQIDNKGNCFAYDGKASGLTIDCAIADMCADGMEYLEIKVNVLNRFGTILNIRQKKLIQRLKSVAVPLATDVRIIPVQQADPRASSHEDVLPMAVAKEV